MFTKTPVITLLSIICIAVLSNSAFACACCAERGTYLVSTGKPAPYELELLNDMKFGPAAELYMTAAGFDDMRGLSAIVKEFEEDMTAELDLVDAFNGNTWTLHFKTKGGKLGTLVLPRPTKLTTRKIDIPDNTSKAPDITLYKEFVFSGSVGSGSGFFRRGIVKPTRYTLVFQGHGNMCDNAEDFENWRLEVKGSKASYAFFGKMKATDVE